MGGQGGGGGGGGGGVRAKSEPPEPKLDPPLLIHVYLCTDILVASYMSMQLVCTSKNIWAKLKLLVLFDYGIFIIDH